MGIRDSLKSFFVNLLDLELGYTDPALKSHIDELDQFKKYYDGAQPEQLKVKAGTFNDNLTVNLTKLIVDKAVSALVGDPADGHGLRWEFPGESEVDPVTGRKKRREVRDAKYDWLDAVWDANKKEVFLHKNALSGAISGFPVVKLVTDGFGGIRIVNLDPEIVFLETDPQDKEHITAYVIRYVVFENGKEVAYMEETKPNGATWIVDTKRKVSSERWELVESVTWPYDFPPILNWQNLPVLSNPYGASDIADIIPIQDRLNYAVSNISKLIRLFAHPNRYGKNLSQQLLDGKIEMGPDNMPLFNGDGEIMQLDYVSDVQGAMDFVNFLRGAMFGISREVDTESLKDKVGAITNFALRVLYRDFLDKLGTKRLLYGNAYQELNRRLFILGGFEPETCDIYWPDPLPVNEIEETTALKADMDMGLVSKQTAQEIRNYDHEREELRIASEKQAGDNAGSLLLQNFFAGRGQQ